MTSHTFEKRLQTILYRFSIYRVLSLIITYFVLSIHHQITYFDIQRYYHKYRSHVPTGEHSTLMYTYDTIVSEYASLMQLSYVIL